ncbi:MAG TPA: anti-sigma factor [Azospirillum sp.]|nr:anti-sigma factor [Azospirillum sp.]
MTDRKEEPVTDADLHAWLDGELPDERRVAVERHLQADADAARRLAAYRDQRALMAKAFGPLIDRPLPDALKPPFGRRRPGWGGGRTWAALAVAASLLLFVAGGAAGWLARGWAEPTPTTTRAFVADAVTAHRVFVVEVRHPVEVGADQEEHLVTWLGKRLGKPLKAPRLSARGYDLVGGRLLADGGGPAAQLMYQDATGRRITLYIRPSSDPADTAFRFSRDGSVQAFYWRDNGLAWAVTGDLDRASLSGIAEEVYGALNS